LNVRHTDPPRRMFLLPLDQTWVFVVVPVGLQDAAGEILR
jgi:hypothetical protein